MASKSDGEVKLTVTFTDRELNLLARCYLRALHQGEALDIQEFLDNDESDFVKDKFVELRCELEPLIATKVDKLLAG